MNTLMNFIFATTAIILMLCTIVEIILGNGFDGLMVRQAFPWLIAGWCIWLCSFYGVRKIVNKIDDENGYS